MRSYRKLDGLTEEAKKERRRKQVREAAARYWKTHPEKLKEKNHAYWEAHAEEINRKRREKYAARKENKA